MDNKQAIIYIRASTNETRQSNSHALQLKSVEEFCHRYKYDIVKIFTEYASGTLDERPVFNEALRFAEENDTMIVSYRLDRLSRSLTVFNRLSPVLHRLRFSTQGDQQLSIIVISVLLSIAQAESKANSERVKMTYKTLKAKDPNFKWGSQITDATRSLALATRQSNASRFNDYIMSIVSDLSKAGYTSTQIPTRLNELAITTRRGKPFTYHNLRRIIQSSN